MILISARYFRYKLDLVRDSLMRARVIRQEATALSNPVGTWDGGVAIRSRIDRLYLLARAERRLARSHLIYLEKINGVRYARGFRVWPLRNSLRGRSFRCWGEYLWMYEQHPLFRGVDPE